MRRAVRRLTWILLSLGLMTVVAFALLSELLPGESDGRALPRFLNFAPRNVRDLSHAAVERLARGPDPAASSELARLGGAALPFLLPNLERLEPVTRERVALALAPVAVRMGAAKADELSSGPDAVSFWVRFWQDRSVDFRESVVRRLVTRLGERSLALRREDVVALDTYALPALIDALGRVNTKEDVMRVRRLTIVLAHVGGQPLIVDKNGSVEQARQVVQQWRRFWAENGADFSALDGPHRVAAMVKETAYGRWLGSVLRGELGRTTDGRLGLVLLRASISGSLLRFAAIAILGTLLGALAAYWSRRQGSFARLLDSSIVLAALPVLALLAPLGPRAGWLATAMLVLWQAALVAAHTPRARLETAPRFSAELLPALALLAPAAPLLLSLVLGLECMLGLHGLGAELRGALERGDLHAAMAVAVGCAVLAAAGMLLSDAAGSVVARLDERGQTP